MQINRSTLLIVLNLKFTILPLQSDMEITSIPVLSHPVNDLCDTQIMAIHLVDTVNSHVGLKTVSYKGRNAVPHNLSSCVLVLRRTTLPWCEQPGCLPPPDPMLILVPDLYRSLGVGAKAAVPWGSGGGFPA